MLCLGILLSAGGAFFTFSGVRNFSEPYGLGKMVLLIGVVMLVVGILLIITHSTPIEEDYEITCPRCYTERTPIKLIEKPTYCIVKVRCPGCYRTETIIVPLDERDEWIDLIEK